MLPLMASLVCHYKYIIGRDFLCESFVSVIYRDSKDLPTTWPTKLR